MSKKIYLAGPMKGLPNQNFDSFTQASNYLRKEGFEVVSPHELNAEAGVDPSKGQPPPSKVRELLKEDTTQLLTCDGVAVLEGWETSFGANAEVFLAHSASLEVKPFMRWAHEEGLPSVLGLVGPKGVGKSTFAKNLADGNTAILSFAAPIRKMLGALWPEEYITDLKNEKVPDMDCTGRQLLQTLGSEWGRNLDPLIWVRFARRHVQALQAMEGEAEVTHVILDDLRFENEAAMVKALGGEVWRIERNGFTPEDDSHVSEAGVPDDLVSKTIQLNPLP